MRVNRDTIEVTLEDGRRVITPLAFYPTLLNATPAQRRNWEFWPGHTAVEWAEIGLELSVASIVEGRKEHVPPRGYHTRLRKWQRAQGMELPPGVTWDMVMKDPRRNW
ncbi:MAG: DUF2442 domain-containing protein [Phycisphaerae bacterium]|nr:DUF2442 domain-containing protein [Phycisphaerae bacterium]